MNNGITPPQKEEMDMRRTKSYPTDAGRMRSCNHGNIRICDVCQYVIDCPFSEDGRDRDRHYE